LSGYRIPAVDSQRKKPKELQDILPERDKVGPDFCQALWNR